MATFNHHVRRADESERRYPCDVRSCLERGEYIVSFEFKVESSGKINGQRRNRCEFHARRYAKKYGIKPACLK